VIDTRIAGAAELSEVLAADFEAEGRQALASRQRFTVAIPGGSVATTCFPHLARVSLEWSRIEFFWTDERGVPPEDPDSNYRLARTLWLGPAGVPDSNIHRMPADSPNLESAAREYSKELRRIGGEPPVLDFVLLGVGEDGHVASLFPDARPASMNQHADVPAVTAVTAVTDAPKPPPRRMSLALTVLTGARRCVVAAFGSSKASAIKDALNNPESALPVASVLRRSARVLLLLDPDAAAQLSGKARLTGEARALAGKLPRR
jgi:6-phosphogluconolactonase